MRVARVVWAFGLLLFSIGCGGGDKAVTPPPVTVTLGSIVPSVTTLNLTAGQSQTITATARDANNGTIASATGYTFSSSSAAVAVVSSAGRVTGIGAGSATVTVSLTFNGVSKSATVAVTVTGTLPTTATVAAGAASNDFTPSFVAIARTGTVTWTFGALAHNVEFGGTAGAPANVPNTTNASVARTFANSGNFNYTCTLHANQNGTILVP